jgi:GAF domain-containing protein
MIEPGFCNNESQRTAELEALDLVVSPPERNFDRITRLAKSHFKVNISLMSMVYKDMQWFKSACGIDDKSTPRNVSFCGHVVEKGEPLVVLDPASDPRFFDNPLVVGRPKIRFYAGAPVFSPKGIILGTLCLLDNKAREFTVEDLQDLKDFASLLETEIEARSLREKTLATA